MTTMTATPEITIAHVEVVLEDRVMDDAEVVVAGGRIVSVAPQSPTPTEAPTMLDGRHRMLLLPGLVDTHNDGYEGEVNPRPRVNFPGDFALRNYEQRSLSGGVTTSFHAVHFGDMPRVERSIQGASERAEAIRAGRRTAAIDHQILHRCDVWSPNGLEPLLASMRRSPVQALSINDHTPGQGQYRDLEAFKQMLASYHPDDLDFDPETELQKRLDARMGDVETVPSVLARILREHRRQPFIIASHDDDTVEKVDAMVDLGASIAEFPVTLEAARHARDRGMTITVGAPNVVRGGSTSGNQDATELVAEGLADILCADYHAPSMLLAAFKLAARGICTLSEAIAKTSANPSRAFGLMDRGRIETGLRADLVLVEVSGTSPLVHSVICGGRVVYSSGSRVPGPVLAGAAE